MKTVCNNVRNKFTSSLGLYGNELLVTGYVRKESKKMNIKWHIQVTKFIIQYLDTVMQYLKILYYPMKGVKLFSLTNYMYLQDADEIKIHEQKNSNILSNIMVVGELGNKEQLMQTWEVYFQSPLFCYPCGSYEVGCINIPRNSKNRKQFFSEMDCIHNAKNLKILESTDTIKSVMKHSKIADISAWWFRIELTRQYFEAIDENTHAWSPDIAVNDNKITVDVEIESNGNVCWSFHKHMKDYSLIYPQCTKKYYSFMVIVVPICMCEKERCLTCIVRYADCKQVCPQDK